jgi:hypothetical protein
MILAGGVAQVVKHLLSKHEALRSNPKKKRRRRRRKKKKVSLSLSLESSQTNDTLQ